MVQEDDRSKSFVVFNLKEEHEEELISKVEEALQELREKPRMKPVDKGHQARTS